MNYRNFEAAGKDVSLLGFGAMRFPLIEGSDGLVDEAEAIRMLRYAIDHGVNYIDTAYLYHGKTSETIVGKALADGYREKVFVATKLPFWYLNGPEDMEPAFNESYERLGVECIDMYLIHDIEGKRMDRVREWKIWDFMQKRRAEGKIRYLGFSFHGESPEVFKEVLDAYPWDLCQLQINFMDKDIQAGVEGYKYAVSKGVPIVVMEPLKGGRLTDVILPSIQKYWDSLDSKRSPAEWALRWVANLPGVLTILSGMSTMEQVEENVRVLSDADVGMMSEAELAVLDRVAEEYRKLIVYPCTACEYCQPCTAGIHISQIMNFRNMHSLYGKTEKMQEEYTMFVNPKASDCTSCGKCEEVCPQHLEIIKAMKETTELFAK